MLKKLAPLFKSIASPGLEAYGFRFNEIMSKQMDIWYYTRVNEHGEQNIFFDTSRYTPNTLRVSVSASQDIMGLQAHHLFKKGEQPRVWWEYQDDESFKVVVHELLDLVLDRGLEWFEVISRPVLEVPLDIEKSLAVEPAARARKFAQTHGLDISNPSSADDLENLLIQKQQEHPDVDWQLILDASAFFGEMVRTEFGGTWTWREDISTTCLLVQIGNQRTFFPMTYVSTFWFNPFKGLASVYRVLQARNQ